MVEGLTYRSSLNLVSPLTKWQKLFGFWFKREKYKSRRARDNGGAVAPWDSETPQLWGWVFSILTNVWKIYLESLFAIFYTQLHNDLHPGTHIRINHSFELQDKYKNMKTEEEEEEGGCRFVFLHQWDLNRCWTCCINELFCEKNAFLLSGSVGREFRCVTKREWKHQVCVSPETQCFPQPFVCLQLVRSCSRWSVTGRTRFEIQLTQSLCCCSACST